MKNLLTKPKHLLNTFEAAEYFNISTREIERIKSRYLEVDLVHGLICLESLEKFLRQRMRGSYYEI